MHDFDNFFINIVIICKFIYTVFYLSYTIKILIIQQKKTIFKFIQKIKLIIEIKTQKFLYKFALLSQKKNIGEII